jgi:hypothetical protein
MELAGLGDLAVDIVILGEDIRGRLLRVVDAISW